MVDARSARGKTHGRDVQCSPRNFVTRTQRKLVAFVFRSQVFALCRPERNLSPIRLHCGAPAAFNFSNTSRPVFKEQKVKSKSWVSINFLARPSTLMRFWSFEPLVFHVNFNNKKLLYLLRLRCWCRRSIWGIPTPCPGCPLGQRGGKLCFHPSETKKHHN